MFRWEDPSGLVFTKKNEISNIQFPFGRTNRLRLLKNNKYQPMKKVSFFLIFLLIGLISSAQTGDRILILGTIEVPLGDDPQGISIFNLTSNRLSVTNSLGQFSIEVAVNDSLRVSSLEFQEFTVIIDQGVISSKTLNIYVSEVIRRLPEVVVTPYDLSGNINVDLNRLKIVKVPVDLSAADVQSIDMEYGPGPDLQSRPYNTALAMSKNRLVNGLNFVNIYKELLISKRKKDVRDPYGKSLNGDIDDNIRKIYKDDFFRENLNIELEHIDDFIYYADDNGLTEQMLKAGNELDLIDFLIEQSKNYKRQQAKK